MKKYIIICLSILCSINCFAQIDSINTTLEEVTVTAREVQSGGCTYPSFGAFSTISSLLALNKIEYENPQTSAHLLEKMGTVLIQRSQGGGGSPIIRGFEANKVLLVVDGVRMNNAIFRGGHLQNVITIDPSVLERVEVFFGGHSLLYGSDALGGVMYFTTRKPMTVSKILAKNNKESLFLPNFKQETNSFVRFSSANLEKTIHADFNFGFKKLAWLSSFTYSNFGDLRSGKNMDSKYGDWGKRNFYVERFNNKDSIVKNADPSLQVGSGYKQYDVLQKILFQQNENTSHILNFQFSNSSNIPRYDRLTETNAKGLPTTAEWHYGPQKRLMAAYHFEHKKVTSFSDLIQVVATYQNIDESRNTRSFGSDKKTQRLENVQVTSINADVRKIKNNNTHQYGLEVQHNIVDSKATFMNLKTGATGAASTRYPDGGSNMTSMAAYYYLKHFVSEKTQYYGGLRYNYTILSAVFKDKTFFPFPFNDMKQQYGALVGSIRLKHDIDKKNTITGSLSSAYRAPNVDDLTKVFESAAGRLIVPNMNLKPEKTIGTELVYTSKLSDAFQYQVVPFATYYRNALTLAKSQFEGKDSVVYAGQKSGVYSTQNLAKAYIYGVSANFWGKISGNLNASANITYTKGRVINDNSTSPLDHIPPVFGRIGLDYSKNKMRISMWTMFNGAKKSSDYRLCTEDNELYSADPINGFSPAWWTLNVRSSYDFTKYTTIQMGVENILDKHYRGFASGISAAGRNVNLTLRTKF
jgi:hemoglobin/transferrin/lactoferrin receptor protein